MLQKRLNQVRVKRKKEFFFPSSTYLKKEKPAMPVTAHANKIVFRNTLEEGVKQQDEEIDFGQRMINSIDVQFVDTNLYMSKELWLPFGSRGAFGGQVINK